VFRGGTLLITLSEHMEISPTRTRWLIVALIFCIGVFMFIDRVDISIAAKYIMPECGLSDVQMGWIFSAFVFGYAVLQIPGGTLGELTKQQPIQLRPDGARLSRSRWPATPPAASWPRSQLLPQVPNLLSAPGCPGPTHRPHMWLLGFHVSPPGGEGVFRHVREVR
jgi:MFS family permease